MLTKMNCSTNTQYSYTCQGFRSRQWLCLQHLRATQFKLAARPEGNTAGAYEDREYRDADPDKRFPARFNLDVEVLRFDTADLFDGFLRLDALLNATALRLDEAGRDAFTP